MGQIVLLFVSITNFRIHTLDSLELSTLNAGMEIRTRTRNGKHYRDEDGRAE